MEFLQTKLQIFRSKTPSFSSNHKETQTGELRLINKLLKDITFGYKLVTLRCTFNPLWVKYLYCFSKIRSYYKKVAQIFELKRVGGAPNGHQFGNYLKLPTYMLHLNR